MIVKLSQWCRVLRAHSRNVVAGMVAIGFAGVVSIWGLSKPSRIRLERQHLLPFETSDQWQTLEFRDDSQSFFIHPGEHVSTSAVFALPSRTRSVEVELFIYPLTESCLQDDKAGIIHFSFSRDGIPLSQSIVVDRITPTKITLEILGGKQFVVTASKGEMSVCDWGGLRVVAHQRIHSLLSRWLVFLSLVAVGFLLARRNPILFVFGVTVVVAALLPSQMTDRLTANTVTCQLALVASMILLILLLPNRRYVRSIATVITIIIVVLPITIELTYLFIFDKPLERNQAFALLQTNPKEAFEYVTSVVSLFYSAGALATLAVCFWILTHLSGPALTGDSRLWAAALLPILIFSIDAGHLNLPSQIHTSISELNEEVVAREHVAELRRNMPSLHASKPERDEVHVVIIGESLARSHLGVYGYARDTTPLLKQRSDLHWFLDTIASDNYTDRVLPMALTAANSHSAITPINAPSLIDVMKAAGVRTYWLSNQNAFGVWDNVVSAIGGQADVVRFGDHHGGAQVQRERHDDVLLDFLREALDERVKQTQLIFLHMMGSHINYCERFPKEFDVYHDADRPAILGHAASNPRAADCYDNSIRFTDAILNSALRMVAALDRPATVLFLSDHGEDVWSGKAHDGNVNDFDYTMVEVPMMIWVSPAYSQRYPEKVRQIMSSVDQPFSNDNIFNVVLDLMGIDTPLFEASDSAINPKYRSKPRLTYGKTILYDDVSKNKSLALRRNTKELISTGEAKRVLPHRVNSLGKAAEVLARGARGLEIDVLIPTDSPDLEVGHDLSSRSGLQLAELLRFTHQRFGSKIRIWLDVKNATLENIDRLQDEIREIDKRVSLMSRTIVECTQPMVCAQIARAGYHVSYYLPTMELLDVIRTPRERQREIATRLASSLSGTGISAVSFDSRLYGFVKEHLEPVLPSGIVFHTWDLSLNLSSSDFLTQLRQRPFFSDTNVKTILVTTPSVFHL